MSDAEGSGNEGPPPAAAPAPGGDDAPINISVKNQQGEEVTFRVKRKTKFGKLFKSYASRQGIEVGAIRFLFDGDRIQDEDTPKMLEMEDNDQIDALLAQVGGGGCK